MSHVPYSQNIERAHKGCFLFLLDQSYSMEEPLGGSGRRKCDELASVCNAWLANLAIACSRSEGIMDYFDIGMFGYRTDQDANAIIESVFQGPLAGRTLASIREIAENPVRIDTVTASLPDEDTGEIIEVPQQVQVWIDPKAEGGTPMCNMLHYAFGVLEEWISQPQNADSYPPIVINITDGESQDGDPIPYADAVKELATSDGNVLLLNCHLSMTAADSFLFPSSDEILPDELARVLFKMSSVLPETMQKIAKNLGVELQPNARGMAFNADGVTLIKFLDLGTKKAVLR